MSDEKLAVPAAPKIELDSSERLVCTLPDGRKKTFDRLEDAIDWIIKEGFKLGLEDNYLVFVDRYLHKGLSNLKCEGKFYIVSVTDFGSVFLLEVK